MSSTKLQATKVYRGGVTARDLKFETDDVELTNTDNALRASFRMKSKGGGSSDVYMEAEAADFPAFLKIMVRVDRQATMAAMSAELACQVAEQPTHDARFAQQARESVREAAWQKVMDAPTDHDDAEDFIWQRVKKLIDELNEAEKAAIKGESSI